MRHLTVIFLFCILSTFSGISQNDHSKWLTNMETAKSEAKTQEKVILMSFTGSDWCSNCMRLEKLLFESEAFHQLAQDKLVLLQLDFPSRKKNQLPAEQQEHNDKLAGKYNPKGTFPTLLVLNSSGELIGKVQHPFNTAEEYIQSIQSLIP